MSSSFLVLLACTSPEQPPAPLEPATTQPSPSTDTSTTAGSSIPATTDTHGDTGSSPTTTTSACPVTGGFEHFITRDQDRLMDGERELRFVSFNIPNLHIVEDPDWHLPSSWEQEDALCSIVQLGGQVALIYTLSVGDSGSSVPRHIPAPGVFSEELFVAFDQMLAHANRYGVRLIVPLVDQWTWWGGIEDYAAFRGQAPEAFWTDETIRADFKDTIEYVLTRTNTITGVAYRDDPAILAWETGNELDAPPEWTAEIAATIKALDPNHLVMDGHYGVDEAALENPDIDIVSSHYYWPEGYGEDYAAAARADLETVAGRRPLIIGEFGFAGTDRHAELLDVVEAEGITGALIWSLRFHDEDGGFYWHTEIDHGGWLVRAYHWPGFDSGAAYDERATMALMRERAFSIQGLPAPEPAIPDPPELFEITDVSAISWRGSTGASHYILERAPTGRASWETVQEGFDDAETPNLATVADPSAQVGATYHYRLRAANETGSSEPSAVQGPITVASVAELVDELDDLLLLSERSEGLALDSSNADLFEGDTARLYRTEASDQWVRYTVDGEITSFEVLSYAWPWEESDPLSFRLGTAGHLSALSVSASNEGGDWVKIIYSASVPAGADTLEITIPEHGGEIWNPQISRVRIRYLE